MNGNEMQASVEEMEEQTRNWDAIQKFNSFMVWEHDDVPDSLNNEIIKSFDWLDISKIPTFNPDSNKLSKDLVLLNRAAAITHKHKRGDVVTLYSPDNPDKIVTKRIIALEGDTVFTLPPYPEKFLRIPRGYCWIEGDDTFHSKDSNTFGPVPLGLINSKVTWILWPFSRFGRVPRIEKPERISVYLGDVNLLDIFDVQE
ncbi:13495_t:CDS:2 [Acaulospora colombiana]|uniref:13495_t:CDS:1 n=1 Tax=Acaulospora colombiana TaxID=27376 RepID=A0ACA9LMN9_9GLOM|nr:13495_t:CDS:2 [Acaulospora colombiana]